MCVSCIRSISRDPKCLVPCYIPGLTTVHSNFLFFFSWHSELYGILVPQSGIKPTLPALEVWNVKHWEVPNIFKERKRQTLKKIKERQGEREEHRSGLWSGPSWDSTSSVWVDETWAQPCMHHGHPVLEADIFPADSVTVRSRACSSQEAMTLHGTTGAWLAPGPF